MIIPQILLSTTSWANVNLFHGRVHDGKVDLGPLQLEAPELAQARNKKVISYIRPHDIEISLDAQGKDFIPAEIVFIRAVGPIVNLELKREDGGEYIEAEIGKDIYRKLDLKERQRVFVRPKDFKVFIPEDYMI